MRFSYSLAKVYTKKAYLFCIISLFSCQLLVAQATDSTSVSDPSATASTQDPVLVSQGKGLFNGNCTVCHQINEKVIGPPLRNVHQRQPVTWIKAFIKNSQKVIESGDPYAVALYKEYNQTQMTAFDFSDSELDAIVAYIISESETPSPTAPTISTEIGVTTVEEASSTSSLEIQFLWIALIIVLVILVVVLSMFVAFIKNYALQKASISEEDKHEHLPQKKDRKTPFINSTLLGFVVFFFVAIAVKSTLDGLFSIGVQQGYQPDQPIAFSHKLHAGEHQIDCNYCHTGVYKSKSANIPSANICMNCHIEIKKESPEIQKIYTALQENRPIEWVRVHNLPDLSYFNHSQHVQVGGIACETCHGDLKNMDIVYQYAPLTMGWCINCHKETEVRTEGNAYYDKLTEIHTSGAPIRVEDIGGLECSKCHY